MNGFEIFLTSAGGLITALGGFQFIKYLMNKKANERMMAAEAFKMEYETIMEDYKRISKEVEDNRSQIAELSKKVAELTDTVDTLKEERLSLIKENNELKLALKEAEHNICVRPDDECFKGRMPVRTYCRLKKLAQGDYDAFYSPENKEEDNIDKLNQKEE